MNIDHLTFAELIALRQQINARIQQLAEAENAERGQRETGRFLRTWQSAHRPPAA